VDVDVTVTLTHTWDEDVDLVLISPAGRRIVLSSDNGLDGNHYTDTVFDDESQSPVLNGIPPFAGRFRPEVRLSNLDHEDPNGTWTLEVRDDALPDAGVLSSWSMTITTEQTGETSTVTDSQGRYLFENLAPGQYFVREVVQPDWLQTAPADGKHDVTLQAGQEALDLDFGNQLQLVTLAGRVYDDQNGDGDGAGDPALAGWVVYRDLNANGARDVATPVTQSFPSSNVPLAIDDFFTQTSSLIVSGLADPIADVDVSLSGTHTFNGDLDVFLVSPSGTRVELFTDLGGANFNPTLDDEAAASIATAPSPFDGTFRPEGLLADFDGQAANGEWTLEITDDEPEDFGNLDAWSLVITTVGADEPFVVTAADGRFEFDFLPPGEHILRQEVQATYSQTEPAGGFYTVTLAAAEQSLELDFGNSQCLHDRDLDNDLDVDRDDLLILFARFGQAASADQGDINCDGSITLADVAELQANLTPLPPPSAPAAVVARVRTAIGPATIGPAAADRALAELPDAAPRRIAAIRSSSDAPSRQATATPGSSTAEATDHVSEPGMTQSAASRSLRASRQRREPAANVADV
jgi:subtilisin-like proprotein convertase family protein